LVYIKKTFWKTKGGKVELYHFSELIYLTMFLSTLLIQKYLLGVGTTIFSQRGKINTKLLIFLVKVIKKIRQYIIIWELSQAKGPGAKVSPPR